jgi:hypothetical protein
LSYCRGEVRVGGLQGQKKAKNSGALMETKGKEEKDDPCSLEVGGKGLEAPFSQSKGTLLAQDKGKKILVESLLPQSGGIVHLDLQQIRLHSSLTFRRFQNYLKLPSNHLRAR